MNLSNAFHLQTYGQVERTIHTLEYMLRSCGSTSKGIGMSTYLSLSFLTTKITIRATKWIHMNLFMKEDLDLQLGGSMLVKHC